MLVNWEQLPSEMKSDAVKKYYDQLVNKRGYLFLKRAFDIVASTLLLILIMPVMLLIALLIYREDKGNPIYVQERVTSAGRTFRMYKFRSMKIQQDSQASLVTLHNDNRITKIGSFIRKNRLDELPQLFNILKGDMTIVGTRPEVRKYVNEYSDEMLATLLLPAGVTSLASIKYKDESEILENILPELVDRTYVDRIMPQKMDYNLNYVMNCSILSDLKIIISTVYNVSVH